MFLATGKRQLIRTVVVAVSSAWIGHRGHLESLIAALCERHRFADRRSLPTESTSFRTAGGTFRSLCLSFVRRERNEMRRNKRRIVGGWANSGRHRRGQDAHYV